jgi:hypothetical protein
MIAGSCPRRCVNCCSPWARSCSCKPARAAAYWSSAACLRRSCVSTTSAAGAHQSVHVLGRQQGQREAPANPVSLIVRHWGCPRGAVELRPASKTGLLQGPRWPSTWTPMPPGGAVRRVVSTSAGGSKRRLFKRLRHRLQPTESRLASEPACVDRRFGSPSSGQHCRVDVRHRRTRRSACARHAKPHPSWGRKA